MVTPKERLLQNPDEKVENFYNVAREFISYASSAHQRAIELEDKFEKDKNSLGDSTSQAESRIHQVKKEDLEAAKSVLKSQQNALENYKTLLKQNKDISAAQNEILNSMNNAFVVAHDLKVKEIESNFEENQGNIGSLPDKLRNQIADEFEHNKKALLEEFDHESKKYDIVYSELFDPFYETANAKNPIWQDLKSNRFIPFSYVVAASSKITVRLFGDLRMYDVPHVIPFLNRNNLLIKCNSQTKQLALNIANSIVLRNLIALGDEGIQLTLADTLNLTENFTELKGLPSKVMSEFVTTNAMVLKKMSQAFQHIIDVKSRCLRKDIKNLVSYNLTSDVKEKYHILYLSNLIKDYGNENFEQLITILRNGIIAGNSCILIQESEDIENLLIKTNSNSEVKEQLSEIERNCFVLDLSSKELTDNLNLEYDNIKWEDVTALPYSEIIDYINKESGDVPIIRFEDYKLEVNSWWKADSANGMEIPIGISRETGKLEVVTFSDKEDFHSGLMVGVPGSGKSNLFHVFIANACMKYSPEEAQFSLVDLKGTEFDMYSHPDKRPPHVAMVASESDREFALSVLEAALTNIKKRQEIFKEAGAKNYSSYRDKGNKMPHEVLIFDEFSELFKENDDISDKATIVIGSLIRLGRAFGCHLFFGTQEFSGTIPSDLISLFPMRFILRCHEDSALKLLDYDNDGHRRIEKTGDLLFNDNKGVKYSGNEIRNKLIKTMFISDDVQQSTLENLNDFSRTKLETPPKPLMVFDISHFNLTDNELIQNLSVMRDTKKIEILLGKAINLSSSDVVADLRKEMGGNLLIVGKDEYLAMQIMNNAIMSAALNYKNPNCSVNIYNSILEDYEDIYTIPNSLFSEMKDKDIHLENSDDFLGELRGICKQIDKEKQNQHFNCFYSMNRLRILRSSGDKDEARELLARVIKEGPEFGFFSIIHIDSIDSLKKVTDNYNILEYFDHRVALQMSADDSSDLLGGDIRASKLYDATREYTSKFAFYHCPSTDIYRKFIVFNTPTREWFINNI